MRNIVPVKIQIFCRDLNCYMLLFPRQNSRRTEKKKKNKRILKLTDGNVNNLRQRRVTTGRNRVSIHNIQLLASCLHSWCLHFGFVKLLRKIPTLLVPVWPVLRPHLTPAHGQEPHFSLALSMQTLPELSFGALRRAAAPWGVPG